MGAASVPGASADECAFFAAHGWLVRRGVASAERLADLAAACERLTPELVVSGSGTGLGTAAAAGVPQVLRPSGREAAFRAWFATHMPWHIAADLFGTSRGHVQLLQDALLIKPPHTQAELAWHRDRSYLGYVEPLRSIAVRLAISPCTEANGCMWVLDGSHTWDAAPDPADAADFPSHDARAQVADGLDPAARARIPEARLPIVLAPGDVSFHDGRTFHASFANTSDATRQTLVAHLCIGGARLIPERLAPGLEPYFPTTWDGALLPAAFPYLPLR